MQFVKFIKIPHHSSKLLCYSVLCSTPTLQLYTRCLYTHSQVVVVSYCYICMLSNTTNCPVGLVLPTTYCIIGDVGYTVPYYFGKRAAFQQSITLNVCYLHSKFFYQSQTFKKSSYIQLINQLKGFSNQTILLCTHTS